MADYYPVLKKTVAALPENTGAARREIYQRARKAIVAQLKAYDPPLSPSEITAEQLRLEECIRRVEAEAARDSLGLSARPAPAAPTASPPAAAQAPAPPPPASEENPAATHPEPRARANAPEATDVAPAATRARPAAAPTPEDRPAEQRREPTLGGASAGADSPRAEPPLGASARPEPSPPDQSAEEDGGTGKRSRVRKRDDPRIERSIAGFDGPIRPSRLPAILGGFAAVLVLVGAAAIGYSQRHTIIELFVGDDTGDAARPAPTAAPAEQPAASRKNSARLLENGETAVAPDARTVTTTRITPTSPRDQATAPPGTAAEPPATTDGGTALQTPPANRDVTAQATAPGDNEPASTPEPPAQVSVNEPPAEAPAVSAPPAASQPEAPAQTAQGNQVTAVAQRAILYEEGAQPGSAGQASAGQSVWSVEQEAVDGSTETVLKIRVEVPERGITANLSLKPNRDSSLPASHLLEISFELPSDFAGRGVDDVPGLVMKTTEEARGDALIGASVKVSDGFFWVALSNMPDEQERNLALLKDRGWIDIPMLYENGKRAILTLEKGTPGTRAVDQAVAAWTKS